MNNSINIFILLVSITLYSCTKTNYLFIDKEKPIIVDCNYTDYTKLTSKNNETSFHK